jgi:hypothetical protein
VVACPDPSPTHEAMPKGMPDDAPCPARMGRSMGQRKPVGQGSGEPSVTPVVGLGVVHGKSSTMSPSAGRGLLPAPQSQGRTTFSRPPASPFQPSTRT